MNEENNQNIPILGSSEGGGGGVIPFPTYSSGTYKIKFSDEYYQCYRLPAGEQMKGRIILLQNDDTNNGNYFVKNRVIYDDAFVDEYVSHFDTKNWMPTLGGKGYLQEHSVIMSEDIILDYEMVDGMFRPTNEYHFVLDEQWYNKHYGEDSNKVLRTFSTGQSDITRHEAYTKAQGLNWANANVPQYSVAQITIKSLGEDTKLFITGKNEQTDGETNLLKFLCNFYQEAIKVDTSAGFDVVNLPVVYEHPYNSVDRIDNPAVITDENGTHYYGIFEINTQTNSVHININVVNGGGETPSTIFVKEVQFYMAESENADAEGTPVGNVVGYDLQLSIEGPLK